ncbi:MAG: hypothetical protein R6U50_11775 [Desulfobacterales bacterium]
MNDSIEAKLKQEIDKIAADVKQIMARVEEIYPSRKPEAVSDASETERDDENADGPESGEESVEKSNTSD